MWASLGGMEPRDAATVMLIRDRDNLSSGPLEVFMLRRNLKLDFVGGAYVFPGGAVDPGDVEIARDPVLSGRDGIGSSSLMGLPDGGLRFWVAAVRESFEEAGVLMAYRKGSTRLISLLDPAEHSLFEGYRAALNRKEVTFEVILRTERLRLACAEIFYFSHWITPNGAPRRYDTRFFLAAAPPEQVALHDDGETIANTWIEPRLALERYAAGEFDLIFPTIRNLEALTRFKNAAEAIEAARRIESIPAITPRMIKDGDGIRVLLPGDPGFDDAPDLELAEGVPLPGRPGGPKVPPA